MSTEVPEVARPLSVERIVAEAIALLDEEGAEALSMRRLAARLGTSPMSTYHHVPDKAALIEAIAEQVMGELERPPADVPWDQVVRRMAASFRSLTSTHPAVFRVLLSGPRPSALIRTADDVVHRFEEADFSPAEAALSFRTIIRYLIGTTVLEGEGRVTAAAQDETFAYGLDAIIAGIQALRSA